MQSSYKEDKELSRKLDSANNVGSFWISRLEDKGSLLSLIDSGYKARLFSQFSSAAEQLLSNNYITVENLEHPLDKNKIIYTGDTRFNSKEYLDISGDVRKKFDEGNVKVWLVKLEELDITSGLSPSILYTVTPIKIISGGGELIIGVDFSIRNGYIEFFQEPEFISSHETSFTIAVGHCLAKSLYRHPLGVDTLNENTQLVKFARNSQSPGQFISAVGSVAGQSVTSYTQRLKEIHEVYEGVFYIFDKENMLVTYPHEKLILGNKYNAGHIIGDGVLGYHDDGSKNWWRQIDFKGGIAMSGLTDSSLILIPDRLVTAFVADVHDDIVSGKRKLHVRIELDGDPDSQDAYWDGAQKRESLYKKYLDDLVVVDTTGYDYSDLEGVFERFKEQVKEINEKNIEQGRETEFRNIKRLNTAKSKVNALDVFFEGILGKRAFVIKLKASSIDNLRTVVAFINKEHPIGCIPIVIIDQDPEMDEVSINEIAEFSYSSSVIEEGSQGADSISLSSVVTDSFVTS